MKNIDELVRIVTVNSINPKRGRARINVETKQDELFSEFSIGLRPSQPVYKAKMQSPTFRKQKSRLADHLIKAILVTDNDRLLKTNFDRQYVKCLKNQILSSILFLNYSKNAAIELLKRNFRISESYHFTDTSINSLRLLKYHAALRGNGKEFRSYNRVLKEKLELLKAETILEGNAQEVILELHHSASLSPSREKEFIKMGMQARLLFQRYPSRNNVLNYCRFHIHLMEHFQKHKEVIFYCNKALKFFQKNPLLIQKVRLAEFALYKLNSCLRTQDIVEGEKFVKECEQIFLPRTDNRYIYLEYYFLLCMHTGNFKNAQKALNQVKDDSRFLRSNAARLEKWKIYESFLAFVQPSASAKQFNVYRFLNEVPLHASDKTGFNLSILIAQIISLLNIGRYDEILEKSEALNIYSRRYIRIKDKYRTYYFMKMLQVMIKYSFEPKKTEQIARKFLEALSAPGKEKQPLEEMEVIPYEDLWKMILAKLTAHDAKYA